MSEIINKQQSEFDKENHPKTIQYKKLQSETEKLKQNINAKMQELHFTEEEKQEINDIIEYHELLKEAAKTPLANVYDDISLEDLEEKVLNNGKQIADNMLKVLNTHMKKIVDRKMNK